jgi:hypothetical protein
VAAAVAVGVVAAGGGVPAAAAWAFTAGSAAALLRCAAVLGGRGPAAPVPAAVATPAGGPR